MTAEEQFKYNIARELLFQEDPDITEETIEKIWSHCNGNPWDAPVLFKLIKLI